LFRDGDGRLKGFYCGPGIDGVPLQQDVAAQAVQEGIRKVPRASCAVAKPSSVAANAPSASPAAP
jgi:hypothetical protein